MGMFTRTVWTKTRATVSLVSRLHLSCLSVQGEKMFCAHMRGINTNWVRVSASSGPQESALNLTTDLPPLQLTPAWGISPHHQNCRCDHTLTHALLFTHWWAFAATFQGTVHGIGCPAILAVVLQRWLCVSIKVAARWPLAKATQMKFKYSAAFS